LPFDFQPLELPGVFLITAQAFPDERGLFKEIYRESDFRAAGLDVHFVQSNMSRSSASVLRGFHYQAPPWGQGKLVQVLEGAIYDVVADVQPESPNFGRWLARELSAESGTMLYIPPEYAHAFCVSDEGALVCYSLTEEFHPESERGVLWSDPSLAVPWPIEDPIVSAKDQALPLLASLRQVPQPS
jgi:dTDP-4-dehydrorhamnose 3,5-epimerase